MRTHLSLVIYQKSQLCDHTNGIRNHLAFRRLPRPVWPHRLPRWLVCAGSTKITGFQLLRICENGRPLAAIARKALLDFSGFSELPSCHGAFLPNDGKPTRECAITSKRPREPLGKTR